MPFRRLSLSRKSSKQSLRENRDETPSVPAVPVGLATKSRPPEASSAGSGATTTSPLDGSVRGKSKSKPPVANNGLAEPFDESSPRKRKTSIATKGKRRISAIFGASPSSRGGSRAGSVEPDSVVAASPVSTNGTAIKTNGDASPAPASAGPALTAADAPAVAVNGVPGIVVDGASPPTAAGERGLPALPDGVPDPAAITAAVQRLQVGDRRPPLTPKASDQSGFPFDTPSPGPGPRNAAAAAAGAAAGAAASGLAVPDGASPLPTSALNTPQRIAKVQNLYSQWADESDSDEDDDDEDGFMTPSEGLSEVEEEEDEEEEDPKASGAYRQVSGKFAAGNGSAAAGADSTAASSTLASELAVPTGPRLRRSKASAATVNKSVDIKFGDPLAVDQAEALPGDLELCRKAITLFLSSQMREAEELITQNDPNHNRMYMQSGHGLVESLKGMMTFDTDDLKWALELTKGTAETASKLRRPNDSVFSKIGGLVRSGAGLARLRAMSPLERHAELVFAETILIKAILAIVSGGDWLGLIKEAFNMRSAHGIYRQLQQFLDDADKDGFDESIDMDFRSGVLLGTGTSSLMLSLLPARVLKIAEVLGYTGDRTVALETLMSAGGWSAGKSVPAYTESNEGIRRPICDMILLTFHLVISVLMPVSGVDIPTARNILDYNMKRYPNGIFFLYFQARLYTSECEPEQANESLQKALELDLEYVQLQHMCLWDYGCNYLQLNNWEGARQCYEILRQESNWSRAVYTYATAVNIMELVNDPAHPEHTSKHVTELVTQIPKLVKKIAGKSLPIEKFIARKARKYTSQDNRLFLPAMELAYVFGSLGYTPRRILLSKWLPHIDAELAKLEASNPDEWGNGTEYWDDYALGHFLRGIVQAVARYQPPEASPNALQPIAGQPSDTELDAGAEADFKKVVECSPNVRLDHYVLYHNHYELGRLYAKRGDTVNAKANFEVVMNTKLPQPNLHAGGKTGKYSLEGALQIKTHAAMQDIKTGSVPASPALVAGKKSAPASIRSSKLKHQV